MPTEKQSAAQKILAEAGVKPTKEHDPVPERTSYLSYLQSADLSNKDQVKELARRKQLYIDVFYLWLAHTYPHLLFEATDDKTYWNYDAQEGVYVELSIAQVRGMVGRLMLEDELGSKVTEGTIRNILIKYRGWFADRGVHYDDFDADDTRFHANNGWLQLDTLTFEPHTPKRLSRRKSAVAYDKDATCPRYDAFLDRDLELKQDQVRVIDQFSGVSLTNDITHQKMLTLLGRPGCGKSTLMEAWNLVLGDMMIEKKLPELQGDSMRFAGSQFVGATLCWFDEVDVKKAELGNNLGTLITGQHINVERKGINGILRARNTVKCVLTANKLPNTAEVGIFRRLLMIPIQVSFTDAGTEDRQMMEKLSAEASGILNRMVRGLRDLRKMHGFTVIEGHEELVEEYKASSDTIAEFLAEYFEPAPESEFVPTEMLLDAYKHFSEGNSWSRSLTPRKFGHLLKTQPLVAFSGIQPEKKTAGKRVWTGLRLKSGFAFEQETHMIVSEAQAVF